MTKAHWLWLAYHSEKKVQILLLQTFFLEVFIEEKHTRIQIMSLASLCTTQVLPVGNSKGKIPPVLQSKFSYIRIMIETVEKFIVVLHLFVD